MSRLTRQLGLDAHQREMVQSAWADWAHYFGFDQVTTDVFRDLALERGTNLRGALPPGYWWEPQEDGTERLMGNIEHAAFERIAGPIEPMNAMQLERWRKQGQIVGPNGEEDVWIEDPINPQQHFVARPGDFDWPLASAYWSNDDPSGFPSSLYYFATSNSEATRTDELRWWPSSDLWWGTVHRRDEAQQNDLNWYASRKRERQDTSNGLWVPMPDFGLPATDD